LTGFGGQKVVGYNKRLLNFGFQGFLPIHVRTQRSGKGKRKPADLVDSIELMRQ
jgi:hypothetical protein